MSTEEQSIRDRIFLATLACIERDGLDAMTVRSIAKEAEVNTAAINYYFGTKARLVDQVLTRTLREGLDGSLDELDELISSRGGDIRAALGEFVPMFFGQMLNWPRLSEAQLHEAMTHQNYDGPAIAETNSFLSRFLEIVRPILPERTEQEQRTAVLQFWLPMMFLGLLPRAFEDFGRTDVRNPDWRNVYVSRLLAVLLEEQA
jgi:AcrR family transcriptional regulator